MRRREASVRQMRIRTAASGDSHLGQTLIMQFMAIK